MRKKGYSRPTAIQMEAIPAAMEERDVLGSAPTGTGKTAAFFITCATTFIGLSAL